MSKASERLQELQIEINAKIAEAQSISMGIRESFTLTVGTRDIEYTGYGWEYNDDTYNDGEWYSSSIGC